MTQFGPQKSVQFSRCAGLKPDWRWRSGLEWEHGNKRGPRMSIQPHEVRSPTNGGLLHHLSASASYVLRLELESGRLFADIVSPPGVMRAWPLSNASRYTSSLLLTCSLPTAAAEWFAPQSIWFEPTSPPHQHMNNNQDAWGETGDPMDARPDWPIALARQVVVSGHAAVYARRPAKSW